MDAIEDGTRFVLEKNLFLETLLPYPDDLFRSVFGKGLQAPPSFPLWFKANRDESLFDMKNSYILLKFFLMTLGVPRGLEILINLLKSGYIDIGTGNIKKDLHRAHIALYDLLSEFYHHYGNGKDPQGLLATIGALGMKLKTDKSIPIAGKKELVSEIASSGSLIPIQHHTLEERYWVSPVLFYDEKLIWSEIELLCDVEGVVKKGLVLKLYDNSVKLTQLLQALSPIPGALPLCCSLCFYRDFLVVHLNQVMI